MQPNICINIRSTCKKKSSHVESIASAILLLCEVSLKLKQKQKQKNWYGLKDTVSHGFDGESEP